MALKATVRDLTSLSEPQRALYKKVADDDGKDIFVLDVEPSEGYELDNVTGLKSALGQERRTNGEASKRLKAFEGIDPAKAREALVKVEEFMKLDPEKRATEIAAGREKQLVEKHGLELKAVQDQLGVYRAGLQEAKVTATLQEAIAKADGNPLFLLPHLQARTRLAESDGRFTVEVLDERGNPAVGDGRGTPMTVDGLVASFKAKPEFAPAFKAPANGGGTKGSTTPAPSGNGQPYTVSRWNARAMTAARADIASGKAVVVDDGAPE